MNRWIVGLILIALPVHAQEDQAIKIERAAGAVAAAGAVNEQALRTLAELRNQLYEAAVSAREVKQIGEQLQEDPSLLPDSEALVAEIRSHLTASAKELQAIRNRLNSLDKTVENNRAMLARQEEELRDYQRQLEALRGQATVEGGGSSPEAGVAVQPVKDGNHALQAGKPDEAAELFRRALEVDSGSVEAKLGLAACHFELGEIVQARLLVDEVLAEDARNPRALGLDGALLFRKGDYAAARKSLERALKADKTSAYNHNYLGVVLQAQNRTSAAIKSVRRAVELDPDYLGARYNLAVLLATARKPDLEEARQQYDTFILMGGEPNPAVERLLNAE